MKAMLRLVALALVATQAVLARPARLADWDEEDVAGFVTTLGKSKKWGEVAALMAEEGYDGLVLSSLTLGNLLELGVKDAFAQPLIRAIGDLKRDAPRALHRATRHQPQRRRLQDGSDGTEEEGQEATPASQCLATQVMTLIEQYDGLMGYTDEQVGALRTEMQGLVTQEVAALSAAIEVVAEQPCECGESAVAERTWVWNQFTRPQEYELRNGGLTVAKIAGGEAHGSHVLGSLEMAPSTGIYEFSISVFSTRDDTDTPYAWWHAMGISGANPDGGTWAAEGVYGMTTNAHGTCGAAGHGAAPCTHQGAEMGFYVGNDERVDFRFDSSEGQLYVYCETCIHHHASEPNYDTRATIAVPTTRSYWPHCSAYSAPRENRCNIVCRGSGCYRGEWRKEIEEANWNWNYTSGSSVSLSEDKLTGTKVGGGDNHSEFMIGNLPMVPNSGIYEWAVTVYSTRDDELGYAWWHAIGISNSPTDNWFGEGTWGITTNAHGSCGPGRHDVAPCRHRVGDDVAWYIRNDQRVDLRYDSNTATLYMSCPECSHPEASSHGMDTVGSLEISPVDTYFPWCQPYSEGHQNRCTIVCRGPGCYRG